MTQSLVQSLSPIVNWLDEERLGSVYSARSWNDVQEEQSKEWWIADGGQAAYARLESYLAETGLTGDYRIAERHIARLAETGLVVADLAAGIGWTSSLLSRLPNVAAVHAVDISRHRLELLLPQAARLFKGDATKIQRHLGSFYELGFAPASVDVVFLSAAFHHASNPLRLLGEIDRVLKPGGSMVLIGENVVGPMAVLRRIAKVLITERRLCTNFYQLFPPDDAWGDHYYRISDYHLFLQLLGYRVLRLSVQAKMTAVVIAEKTSS